MRIAILHFHLRRGGVTRVVELATQALCERGEDVLVIVGEAPQGGRLSPDRIAVVPELTYGVGPEQADALRENVEAACLRRWGTLPDVWHIHNHALGKNFALPLVVRAWAEQGQAMILQLHDFAENGRPQNYQLLRDNLGGSGGLSRTLYPVAPRVHYALLTAADGNRLALAGLAGGWHILPNSISVAAEGEPFPAAQLGADRMLVYPARAIRRKNIGEALVWSSLAEQGEVVVLTVAPLAWPDLQEYDAWKEFARNLTLPVVFDAQDTWGRPTNDFLFGADRCLTTSVAEGFGMAFLEPWMANRPVVGRDLATSTGDFRAAGVKLDGLYSRLDFPASWLDADKVRAMIESAVRRSCEAYQIPLAEEHRQAARDAVEKEGLIDFGRLNEALQREVLQGLRDGRFSRDKIRPATLENPAESVAVNQAVIAREYSNAAYGENLALLYRGVIEAEEESPDFLDASAVLQRFLGFDDFSGLRF